MTTSAPRTTARGQTSARNEVPRLARLLTVLDERRKTREELAALLESVKGRGLMTVVGEEGLLRADVDRLLRQATVYAEELAGRDLTGKAASIEETITELEKDLGNYLWETAEWTLALLEEKRARQDEVIRGFQVEVDRWRGRIDDLRKEVQRAHDTVRAPLRHERYALSRIDALVTQAARALGDGRYADVSSALRALREEDPDQLTDEVHRKAAEAALFNRQADVLLLRSGGDGMHSYTVLLRTPSEPGSHGINIQDDSNIVDSDREYLCELIDTITKAVDAGMARKFQDGKAAEPGSAPPAGGRDPPASGQPEYWRPDSPVDSRGAPPTSLAALIGEVGNTMFRLLMPERMREYLAATPCSLTITTNDLELPWELMYDRDWEQEKGEEGLGFLCLQRPIARMPMGRAFPRARRATEHDGVRFLLVYADPDGNLSDAEKEIQKIHAEFEARSEIEVTMLRREEATGKALNRALLSGDYDIIHFAGHAYFNEADPDASGLLLHGREKFLSQKIQRFVEGGPLVFLNACQTGRTANESAPQSVGEYFWKPAEGLASALLYGGALGCVGSLWPVYDEPAADFAVEFYRQVLEGQMIGEAMRESRRKIKASHPESITWAAFVLYGDPTFQLVR
jgi:hypothetical protein